MKCTIAILLLGVAVAQAHYVPTKHHGHHHATNELDQGEDYLWDDSHAEAPRKWTGPIHVPVIKNGVPTETPEVRHAKAHLEHKLAEAKSHADYHSEEDCDEEEKKSHHAVAHHAHHVAEHHAHHQQKWTGPVHVPVIEHGVPTETPEVRHAKAAIAHKLAEAKKHSGHHENKWQHHEEHEHHHYEPHHQQKWTGPVHVPVIEHGVPTETPEVRHAKAAIAHKLAEAKKHSGHHDEYEHHHYEPHHQQKWTGPVHVPVIEHGVPTETPEVRQAKAAIAHKLAEAKKHSGHHENKWQHHEEHEHHHYEPHHQQKWTGPVHVPVIEHGVPTETPEVRHAKAAIAHKLAEAKQHPEYESHEEEDKWAHHGNHHQQQHHVAQWAAPAHHEHASHHGEHRWTGPVHVPVIKHGVPTETPEVQHAKALLHAKHAEAKAHPEYKEKDCDDEEAHHAAGFAEAVHGDHQTRHWSHGAHKFHF
ncbi:histidine-rich glycoprotein-like [Lutzomyia longipalpis]|uniref:histidine-rich glycoprotein-like n=1 Tax=Lutzomyia longipalpis TaxID=7200 RepID=UPI002483C000|nr:histidine-rich glycoprotein-like [Lutzomyia longipalpis]